MIGLWTLSGQAGYSRSSEDSPGHIANAVFAGNDDFADSGFYSNDKPRPIMGQGFYDANNFSLDKVDWEKQNTQDTEKNLRLDLARDYDLSGYASQVKFGGKVSRRNKDNDLDAWVYEDFDDLGFSDDQLNLSRFAKGSVDYRLGQFGPGISGSAIKNLIGGLNRDDFYDPVESTVNDFKMSEDINAGYLMNTVDIDDWRSFRPRYEAPSSKPKEPEPPDGDFEPTETKRIITTGCGPACALSTGQKTPRCVRRGPSLWCVDLRPTGAGFVIEVMRTFGNPELKPLESSNPTSVSSIHGHADGAAFVFTQTSELRLQPTWPARVPGRLLRSAHFCQRRQRQTLRSGAGVLAKIRLVAGTVERSVLDQHHVQSLRPEIKASMPPLALTANAASICPASPTTVGNLMLGWENDKVSLRLSANYKSDYLYELASISDKAHDLHVDAQTFVDFSARYSLTKNLQLSFEAQNLTDESYFVYTGHRAYNGQYEEYGPTYKLGLTFTHF